MRTTLMLLLLCWNTLSNGQAYIKDCQILYNKVYSADEFSKKDERDLLQTCNEIYSEAIDEDNTEEALQSITTAIRIYSELGDQSSVLKHIEKAMSLAREQRDDYRLSLLYTYMGRAFTNLGFYDKAKDAFDIGLRLAIKVDEKDNGHILKLQHYGGIAMIFEHSNPPNDDQKNIAYRDSMIFYAKQAYTEAKMISPQHTEKALWLGYRARILGSVFLSKLNYEAGAKYLGEAEKLLSALKDKRFMISLYRFKGILVYNSSLPDRQQKALYLYNKSYSLALLYDIPAELYFITDAMAGLYSEMKMTVPARLMADESKKIKYEIDQNERKAILIAEKTKVDPETKFDLLILTYAIIGMVAVIIVTGYYYIYRRRPKHYKHKENITEVNAADIESRTEQINRLIKMIKDNDGSFYIVFKEVFPEFQKKLLYFHPNLTGSDLELCAYLKLNLQTKEIAIYKKNSVSSVDNRKSRLRKKLKLSSETNLYVWIDNI